ncbi:MAG TPA: M1 family metallopeptidase [Candidatus Saccharibacteria bacterium]|nr:M1 family metallopeptidase [Candidatus Saccharibacteria bacterium]
MSSVLHLTQIFSPSHYQLSLDIDRPTKTFSGTVTINGELLKGDTVLLHAKELTITEALVDGHRADFQAGVHDELSISTQNLQTGKHVVVIGFSGNITDSMHGMYPCYFTHDGVQKELIATQFESHHAREVFPCVDEPEAKATFDVTLTTEQVPVVLGNMPIAHQKTENNRLVTTFETTPVMSSYLLAWVYGDMLSKTAKTKNDVEVTVWATVAQSDAALDFSLDIAVRALEFFEQYYGVPYPLPKCDHVALPDFSSGAMENWGLITYRESVLLVEPGIAGVSSRHLAALVIAHELSHQWFGNLVTMKWWNNLWLNESFANLMEYLGPDALHPEWQIWNDFNSHEAVAALRRDAIDGVQSVQVDVNHPDEISTLFDPAIVYAKGGRLMRMLQRYLGDEDFQKGLRAYFTTHAYGNTEESDLWRALSDTSGKDITSFMSAWITQPGYPVVHANTSGLSQEQFFVGPHQNSVRIWPIPLGANSPDLPELFTSRTLEVPLKPGIHLNTQSSAHFITHYSPELLEPLIAQVRNGEMDETGRFQLLHEQTLLARAGVVSSATLIPLLDAYSNETVESVWESIALTIGELKKFVETDKESEAALKVLAGKIAKHQFERLGWTQAENETETDTKLRATIVSLMMYSEDPEVLAQAKDLYDSTESIESLDSELRSLILGTVVRHFPSKDIVEKLLSIHDNTTSAEIKIDICSALTSTKDGVTINTLLKRLKGPVRSQDVARWFAYLIRNRDGRNISWQWMKDNWSWIEKTYAGDKSFDDFPHYAASSFSTNEYLKEYSEFFKPLESIPALTRVIAMGKSEIEGRIELLERDGDAVRKSLREL